MDKDNLFLINIFHLHHPISLYVENIPAFVRQCVNKLQIKLEVRVSITRLCVTRYMNFLRCRARNSHKPEAGGMYNTDYRARMKVHSKNTAYSFDVACRFFFSCAWTFWSWSRQGRNCISPTVMYYVNRHTLECSLKAVKGWDIYYAIFQWIPIFSGSWKKWVLSYISVRAKGASRRSLWLLLVLYVH